MQGAESWFERTCRADGDHDRPEAFHDEWAGDHDQQFRTSGIPCIAISSGLVERRMQDTRGRLAATRISTRKLACDTGAG